jgi:hypothetical protein
MLGSATGLLRLPALVNGDILTRNAFRRILRPTGRSIVLLAVVNGLVCCPTLGVGVSVMGTYMVRHDSPPVSASIAV